MQHIITFFYLLKEETRKHVAGEARVRPLSLLKPGATNLASSANSMLHLLHFIQSSLRLMIVW